MSKPITITLPLPERILSPNARTHWARKAKAVKQAREDAEWAATYACQKAAASRGVCWGLPATAKLHMAAATITVQPYYRDRRRRDTDNLLASLKPSIDGLVDAGLLADDNRITYTVHPAEVDKDRPRVEITVQEATE